MTVGQIFTATFVLGIAEALEGFSQLLSALALLGAADTVSVVIRFAVVQ